MSDLTSPNKYLFGFSYGADLNSMGRLLPFLPEYFFAGIEEDILRAHAGFLQVIAASVEAFRGMPPFMVAHISNRHPDDLSSCVNSLAALDSNNTLLQLSISNEGTQVLIYTINLFGYDANGNRAFLLKLFSMEVWDYRPITRQDIANNWQQNNTEFCHEWLYLLVGCFETIRIAALKYKAVHY